MLDSGIRLNSRFAFLYKPLTEREGAPGRLAKAPSIPTDAAPPNSSGCVRKKTSPRRATADWRASSYPQLPDPGSPSRIHHLNHKSQNIPRQCVVMIQFQPLFVAITWQSSHSGQVENLRAHMCPKVARDPAAASGGVAFKATRCIQLDAPSFSQLVVPPLGIGANIPARGQPFFPASDMCILAIALLPTHLRQLRQLGRFTTDAELEEAAKPVINCRGPSALMSSQS